MSIKQIIALVLTGIAAVTALVLVLTSFYNVDASEIAVHQSMGGELTVWDKPGWKYQGMGKVTSYKKSGTYVYNVEKDASGKIISDSNCLNARFNDQGKAVLCGQLSYKLSKSSDKIKEMHVQYGSMNEVLTRLIQPTIAKSIYNSSPLISSKQSAGSHRAKLMLHITNQAIKGTYKTETKVDMVDDLTAPPIEVTELQKTAKVDEDGNIILDKDDKVIYWQKPVIVTKYRQKGIKTVTPKKGENGEYLVQEKSTVSKLGIGLFEINIERIIYEKKVKEQIDKQRDSEMSIVTKRAEALTAKQNTITIEENGKAKAAEAKWNQETLKATAIAKAEQKTAVAVLNLEAAKLERKATVEKAKGEAEAKKLVMTADGALAQKLASWEKVSLGIAKSLGNQALVPRIIIGSNGGKSGGSSMTDMMSVIMAKSAADLSLNTKIK